MNCQDVQDNLYANDAPGGTLPPEVEAHLATCSACALIRQKLTRLEQAVRGMPADAALFAWRPPPLAARPRRAMARAMRAAALLLLGVGIWAWLHWRSGTEPAPDPDVIAQLVAWNVDLAERPTLEERAQTFRKEHQKLRSRAARARLNPVEKRLADQLLANGEWMTRHDDSLGEAERFSTIAQDLVDHMDRVARQDKTDALDRLSGSYCMVVDRGIRRKLDKVHRAALKADEQQRIEQIMQSDRELQRKLQDLLARSPQASRKQIQRALKSSQSVWH